MFNQSRLCCQFYTIIYQQPHWAALASQPGKLGRTREGRGGSSSRGSVTMRTSDSWASSFLGRWLWLRRWRSSQQLSPQTCRRRQLADSYKRWRGHFLTWNICNPTDCMCKLLWNCSIGIYFENKVMEIMFMNYLSEFVMPLLNRISHVKVMAIWLSWTILSGLWQKLHLYS